MNAAGISGGRRTKSDAFMKRLRILCAAALVFQFTVVLGAQQFDFSGNVKSVIGAYLYGGNAGKFSAAKQSVSGVLDASAGNCAAYIDGSIIFDGIKAAYEEPFSVKAGLSAALKEAWFSWNVTNASGTFTAGIKAGRQVSAWGKADGVAVADVLCPKDITNLYSSTYSESRLGIDALKLNLSGTYVSSDFYWIPIFRPSALPLEKSDSLRKIFVPESMFIPVLGKTLPVNIGTIETPETKLENSSYAAKISFWLPLLDFSFYGYYGFADTPVLTTKMSATEITLNGEYKRFGMAAFDAAIPIKSFVLRAETAFFIDKAYSVVNDSSAAKNGLKALAGLDWTHSSWMLTAQYFENIIFDFDENITDAKERANGTTFSLSRSFFAETLKLSFTSGINWQDFDSFASLTAEYSVTDQLSVLASAEGYFEGKSLGEYGKYKELSSVRLEVIYRF